MFLRDLQRREHENEDRVYHFNEIATYSITIAGTRSGTAL